MQPPPGITPRILDTLRQLGLAESGARCYVALLDARRRRWRRRSGAASSCAREATHLARLQRFPSDARLAVFPFCAVIADDRQAVIARGRGWSLQPSGTPRRRSST